MTRARTATLASLAFAALLAGSDVAPGAPLLSITLPGAATQSTAIVEGTPTLTLGLRLDTDGNAIDSLLMHIEATPSSSGLKYAITNPVIALDAPFTAADLSNGAVPTGGAVVDAGAAGMTLWSKATGGANYGAFAAEIGRYTFDTSALLPGEYVLTPVGSELVNDFNVLDPITTFASPGTFALTVTVVPEPTALGAIVIASIARLRRGRRVTSVR